MPHRHLAPARSNSIGLPGRMSTTSSDDIAAVLFDLDGVLIDSARAWHRIIKRGTREFGCPPVSYETFIGTFGQGPEADRDMFFPSRSVEDVSDLYHRTFPEELDAVELMPGSLEILDTLRGRNIKRAVVTNTPRDLAEKVLQRKAITERVDVLSAAGDAPEKPAPDLLLLALAKLRLQPERVLYVGDSNSDRAAARAAGVFMIGLNHPGDTTITRLIDLLDYLRV